MGQRDRWGRVGIWSSAFSNRARSDGTGEFGEAVAELAELGYGAIWLGGSPAVAYAEPVLRAAPRIIVATGILSIWEHTAIDVAAQRAELERTYPGRFVLGLGVSHSQLAKQYERPYSAMRDYLAELDSAAGPVPVQARVLAALGPKMLALSRDRSAGAHPYLVTPEHTAAAREILGPDALLAPDFKVVLDTDLDQAADTARNYLQPYLAMPNYTNNFLRLGFEDDDFRDGGSDRLINAVFAIGDADTIASRAAEFLTAGADHLAVQAITDDSRQTLPRAQWRRLAEVLTLG